ncbi:MAG: glycosyltransferase family 4 protein [Actinomycetota bacterium]
MTTLLQVTTSAEGGGIQTLVGQIADAAAERGWRSVVAYYRGSAPANSKAEYVRLPAGGRIRTWPFHFAVLARRLKPDVVHVHGVTPGSIGAAAARAAGFRRIVYTDHFVHSLRPSGYRHLRRAAASLPLVNIAVCDAVSRSLIADARIPASRVLVIRNGTAEAAPLARPDEDRPRLAYVANLWPWKGHGTLLRAISLLGGDPPARIVLIGDGPERTRIEGEITRLGIDDSVVLTGRAEDPWAHMDGAWAYVHPSSGEGLPLAVMEAMMRGLPVVAASSAGIPEIVEHERTGLLVPSGDPAALALALRRILADRALRDQLAQSAREFAMSNLRIEDCLDAHFRLYERVSSRAAMR